MVREAISAKERERMPDIIQAVKDCGSLDYTRDAAERCRDQALASLATLPDSPARGSLERLARIAVERRH